MSWKFLIAEGRILKPDGSYHCTAYSGAPGYIDNPDAESLRNLGPIPEGLYRFGTPVDTPDHGPFFIPLIPDPTNRMYNRGSFGWHGDSIKHPGCASQGCVISIQLARRAAWESEDHVFEVVRGNAAEWNRNAIAEGAD